MSDSLSTSADALGGSAGYRPALMGTRHMAAAGHYAAAHAAVCSSAGCTISSASDPSRQCLDASKSPLPPLSVFGMFTPRHSQDQLLARNVFCP